MPAPAETRRRAWSGPEAAPAAFWVSILSAVPLLIWWLGWYPGLLSSTSVAQLAQIEAGSIGNEIPAVHSILLWVLTGGGALPALATLAQAMAFVALMAIAASRLTRLGAPWPLTASFAVLFAWVPAVSATVISLELQALQGVVGLWLLAELLEVARRGPAAFEGRAFSTRFGVALGLAWLLDHGGLVVVAVVAGAVLWVGHRDVRRFRVAGGVTLGVFLAAQVLVYPLFGVEREVPPVGLAYTPEVAAVYNHDPAGFVAEDLALMSAVAPLEVWEGAYRCDEGVALITDREFDGAVIRADPGAYRGLVLRTALSAPSTVIGHRACAARFLFVPAPAEGERYATYAYNVPPNSLGIVRDSQWEAAFNMTKAMLVRTDQPGRLWLFWRPGLVMWPALAALAVAASRSRRNLVWPGVALIAHLVLAVLTVRVSSFREAFPVYVLAFSMLPLWWPALRASAVGERQAAESG